MGKWEGEGRPRSCQGGVGLGAGRDVRLALHKGYWSGGRVRRKTGMVERGLPGARGRGRPGEAGRG